MLLQLVRILKTWPGEIFKTEHIIWKVIKVLLKVRINLNSCIMNMLSNCKLCVHEQYLFNRVYEVTRLCPQILVEQY